jgi:predicted TPR repeat methyltransferase
MPKACNVGFDTPVLLRKLVDEVIDESKRNTVWAQKGVDLGCGSGCSGLAFRSCIGHLTGVDISPEMVDKARGRGCYDHILVGNIGNVLCTAKEDSVESANDAAFDIIFACNVLSFIHDIRDVFQSVHNNLKPIDGVFAFSAELIEGEKDANYNKQPVLQSCARYAHERNYVESLASEFGFETKAMKTSDIRIHEGRVIKGVLAVMTLSSSAK